MMRVEGTSSKCRRDLINNEIQKLRDMLPLHEAVKSRLSYLHIMSLTCAYIRKGNYFSTGFKITNGQPSWVPPVDFTQAVNGFLMVVKCDGKLIYVSENVTDYLGHSMIELLATGGDIYSIIDSRDHDVIFTHLSKINLCQHSEMHGGDKEVSFLCRMNTARNMRRNDITLKNKVILMRGRYAPHLGENHEEYSERALMLTCLPIECWSSVGEEMVPYNTETFYMLHSVDMKILEASPNVFFYTGYHDHELEGTSWYNLVHHEDLPLARTLHSKMIQFGTKVERSSGVIRLVSTSGCQQCASVTISECDTIRHTGKNGVIGCFITQTHIIRQSEIEFYINEVASNSIPSGYSFSPVDDGESETSMPSQPLATIENHLYEENVTNISTIDVMEPNVPNIDSHYNEMPCNFNACETPLNQETQLMMYKPFEALKSAAKLLVCDRLKRDVDKFRIPYSHAMEIINNLDQSEYCNQTQPPETPTNQDTAFLDELASLPLMTYACSSHENVSGYVQVTCQSQVTMGIPGQVQPPGTWS